MDADGDVLRVGVREMELLALTDADDVLLLDSEAEAVSDGEGEEVGVADGVVDATPASTSEVGGERVLTVPPFPSSPSVLKPQQRTPLVDDMMTHV